MLITPNNDYIEFETFLENARIFFNGKITEYYGTNISLSMELSSIFNKQLQDINEVNFKTKFQTFLINIENKLKVQTPAFNTQIKNYVDIICSYRRHAEPTLICFNEFKWESDELRKKEWLYAIQHLTNNGKLSPDGTKLCRKEHSALTHSFIVVDRRILVMGPKKSSIMTGSNVYADNVKLAEDKKHGAYAIKIIKEKAYKNESLVALDLGMALPAVQRKNKSNFFKAYIPYVYAGITLSKYLKMPHTDKEYMDIAIHVVEAILSLHSGEKSQTQRMYSHSDIHAYNITVDNKGQIHLIDYGRTTEMHQALIFFDDKDMTRELISSIFPDTFGNKYPDIKRYMENLCANKIPLAQVRMDLKRFKEQLVTHDELKLDSGDNIERLSTYNIF